jgi:hypothetical protein
MLLERDSVRAATLRDHLARIRQSHPNDAPLERQLAQLEAQIARMGAPR